MELSLKVIEVLPAVSGVSKTSGKQWKKQEFIGATNDLYPKKVCITVFNPNDDTQIPLVGDDVVVEFEIDSHAYVDRNGVERFITEILAKKITNNSDTFFPR